MEIKTYKEFYEFLRDIKFLELDGMVARLKVPEWKTRYLVLEELEIQYGSAGGALIANGKLNGDGHLVHIPLNGSSKVNGKRIQSDSVLVCIPDNEYFIAVNDVHEWLNLFIPMKVIRLIHQKYHVSETKQPNGVVHVGKDTVSRLKKAVQEVFGFGQKVNGSPNGSSNGSNANGKTKKEILSIYENITLKPPETEQMVVGRRIIDRSRVMLLIKNKLQSEPLDKIFVEDLAIAANVSGRTLRKIFIEYFGVSPLRYLTIYKMHAARKVLQDSNPNKSTVSNIASQFGFRHFGRFASSYRDLFGELPLDTLNNNYKK